ncbi:MAG: methyltransferase domain-containing protein [wastewater metagenome]|nr:methyltransferase domain-containing protein [Candidatus Loosdrechtia aerotolerans]
MIHNFLNIFKGRVALLKKSLFYGVNTELECYVKENYIRKLQLGSGENILASWLNTDLEPRDGVFLLDVTKPLPFEKDVFDYIFFEHLIEHLEYLQGINLLKECHRILRHGGKIRIATPDLEFIVKLYHIEKTELLKRYIAFYVDNFLSNIKIYDETFVINLFFREWGHKFIYNFKILSNALKQVGFVNITHCKVGESMDKHLQNIESHGKAIGIEFNNLETFVIEATKIGSSPN